MAALNAEQIRTALFCRKLEVQPLNVSLPGLSNLDGLLAVRELSAKDTADIAAMSKDRNGTTNEALAVAGLVIRGLVLFDTKEPIFADTELDSVAAMGFPVLQPIAMAVNTLSGLDADSLAASKKNLTNLPASTSPTSSPANSEAASLSAS